MFTYPYHLNKREHYLQGLNEDRSATIKKLKEIVSTRYLWMEEGPLDDDEDGINDEMHEVHGGGR